MVTLRVLLVGGAVYEPLYGRLAEFTEQTGIQLELSLSHDHPDLNRRINAEFSSGTARYDLISTHTKYAPAQKQWLTPLPELMAELADFEPRTTDLAHMDGAPFSIPRNLDLKLLHYRTDLIPHPPTTWEDFHALALKTTDPPARYGFAFPGKESGLFGHFYELHAMAGGTLFNAELEPCVSDEAGFWALKLLVDLYRRAAPPETPDWHYDQVSSCFRAGRAAMTSDWPGSFFQYTQHSTVAASTGLALYPSGPAGRRIYAGCHSFAIPVTVQDRPAALELLRFLTGLESQTFEARLGSFPARRSALDLVRREAHPGSLEAQRWELLRQAAADALVPPRFARYPDCEERIWRGVRQALLGQLEVAAALNLIEREIRAVLS